MRPSGEEEEQLVGLWCRLRFCAQVSPIFWKRDCFDILAFPSCQILSVISLSQCRFGESPTFSGLQNCNEKRVSPPSAHLLLLFLLLFLLFPPFCVPESRWVGRRGRKRRRRRRAAKDLSALYSRGAPPPFVAEKEEEEEEEAFYYSSLSRHGRRKGREGCPKSGLLLLLPLLLALCAFLVHTHIRRSKEGALPRLVPQKQT